jgi:hypothetical protein
MSGQKKWGTTDSEGEHLKREEEPLLAAAQCPDWWLALRFEGRERGREGVPALLITSASWPGAGRESWGGAQ